MNPGEKNVSASGTANIQAIVLVNDPGQATGMGDTLAQRGISAIIMTDPEEALLACRSQNPHLVVVEESHRSMRGARFLAELLKISWTTSTILICDEEEEVVHERTEGLGILGSIRSSTDIDGLQRLIDVFFAIRVPVPSFVST
jgi:DNA-binding NarL/FixJ family response regulator